MTWIDFADPDAASSWRTVHDRVMGGVSSGTFRADPGGYAVFSGTVSLENNGGFASARTRDAWPVLARARGVRLQVRGDGRTYKLGLRTDERFDGMSWQASFATRPGEWLTIDVPFEDFVPTWHGRLVSRATTLDRARITSAGLLVSDKQAGDFRLDVRRLSAWTDPAPAAAPWPLESASALRDAWRGSRRLLVIRAPGDLLEESTSLQRGALAGRGPELAERDLTVVVLTGRAGGRVDGQPLAAETAAALADAWGLPAGRWSCTLVGKDGGVKGRWDGPVAPDRVFALIDGMPMRRREMAERGDERVLH